ncbi:chorismate synthase [Temperatibacter marinus]|uniref:Chorismate synthase n=1 Tax=Temperatibacter marinus TaxID=1456591 RepID=A0AA52H8Y2_9PROT|nr:chorismate synthase [Temperatibacter marinus]WND01942.1 chorismate synthase [Temperatibacter marinus]
MSFNTFGHVFRFTTWGESHGPAIGCTVDGVPPGLPLDEAYIQQFLDKRKPGQSKFTTQRKEPDLVKILSGVFEGKTTGTPIQLMIENVDQRSKDYGNIAETYRPGHADITYDTKYGFRDYRGGGRSSARETASRVAAGAIARLIIGDTITIRGAMVQMGPTKVNRDDFNWETVHKNPFFCPSAVTAESWEKELTEIRKAGSSIGAVIEIVAEGVPAGIGAPLYRKLDSDLACAMMTINAVKGVEIGVGMEAALLTGEENADEMTPDANGNPVYLSNKAGGVLGGIATGQPVVCRFSVKPTSSILTPKKSITRSGDATEVMTKGRHDPCVGIRAVPVGEAMMAIVLADQILMHKAQCG